MWNRDFLLLWQGLLVSQIGTQLFSLSLLYWILETTGSASIMGLVLMSAALPGALLGAFAGTLADNVSRKTLIVWADVVRGLSESASWACFGTAVQAGRCRFCSPLRSCSDAATPFSRLQ